MTAQSAELPSVSSDVLVWAASEVWSYQEMFTGAMTAAYREEATAQILSNEHERSALVAALLEGQITDRATLWEAADLLRISPDDEHVVIAAEAPDVGREAMPRIEGILSALGVPSAWRLLPNTQVGIASLRRPAQQKKLTAALEREATGRVGISPPYAQLDRTAHALRLARIAMTASPPNRPAVTAFDDAPLSVAAVSDPR